MASKKSKKAHKSIIEEISEAADAGVETAADSLEAGSESNENSGDRAAASAERNFADIQISTAEEQIKSASDQVHSAEEQVATAEEQIETAQEQVLSGEEPSDEAQNEADFIAAQDPAQTAHTTLSDDQNDAAPPADKITDINEIEQALQAIIFAAPKAMSLVRLRNLLNSFNFDTSSLSDVLQSMIESSAESGFQLVRVGGGYQYRSHPKHADILQKLLEDKPTRLSNSALEVLAIIAYKQPLTRTEVDTIRGTDSGHLVKGLLEKNLVRTSGHAETPGRPLLYETTPYFLEIFTMSSLDDLPNMEEFKRELQEGDADGGSESGFDILAADPAFYDKESPLAANPDRGQFDEPNEEQNELPDFGSADKGAEA